MCQYIGPTDQSDILGYRAESDRTDLREIDLIFVILILTNQPITEPRRRPDGTNSGREPDRTDQSLEGTDQRAG